MLDRPTPRPLASALRTEIAEKLRQTPRVYVLVALAAASWAVVALFVVAAAGISRALTGI
jgi:hypothetical protein